MIEGNEKLGNIHIMKVPYTKFHQYLPKDSERCTWKFHQAL